MALTNPTIIYRFFRKFWELRIWHEGKSLFRKLALLLKSEVAPIRLAYRRSYAICL